MPKFPKISVIIPSIGRSEKLRDCLSSLKAQTFKNFEYIVISEEGPLTKLRNHGAREAKGNILVFTDDDVVFDKGYLKTIVATFKKHPKVVGVSGPAIIPKEFKQERDLFKYSIAKVFYDKFFCEGKEKLPGTITRSGAWTTGASEETTYEGEVDFLEACNMSFRRDAFFDCGGFDEEYGGVGDWSEPDLSFRLREKGGKLWFSQGIRLEHRPSKSGAYGKRKGQAKIRYSNYELFSKRWVKPCWRHSLYKLFMRTYYAITSIK